VFGDVRELATARRFETYVATTPFATGESTVVEEEGRVVSGAWSVRESERAAECAVETLDGYRRRGYGARVTAAWIDRVLADGKVPFFSHAAENEASRALAVTLGLTHVFTVLSFE
jgi:predicted GNAT family acetyltransferase